jgi:RHS repeat-associated protein
MKKLFYILSFIPVLALAQSQDQNYVKTVTYKLATTVITSPTDAQKVQNITYYDGLGRPIQQVAYKQSATGKDIITPIEYDDFGRQEKEYLPYVPTTAASQNYLPTALTDVGSFYNTSSYENTLNPYSKKEFENSPLSKVLKQAAPGNSWSNGSGHEIKFDYQTNTAIDDVKLFAISATWDITKGLYDIPTTLTATTYTDNQLYKTITYDENSALTPIETNGSTVEFKDKEGHVVLKRTYNQMEVGSRDDLKERYDTYYVYDQYGNLTFVIPPKVDTSIAITTDVLNNLCYQYRYDYRNRLVEKKLPGKQWEFIVYDKLDRVIATGPAFSPFSNSPAGTVGWMITKYDVFNRPIITGWMQSTTVTSAGRKILQDSRNLDTILSETKNSTATDNTVSGISFRYSVNAFPTGTMEYYILSVNYYDDYNYLNAPTIPTGLVANQSVYYNTTIKPKGLTTGIITRIPELTTTTPVKTETSYSFYDIKARGIRAYTKNHLGGFTQVDTNYETMTGRVNYTITTHNRNATTTATQTIQDNYTYSDQDRLLSHTQSINGVQPPELIAENNYNELGQLISKKVGNTTSNPLQKVDYTYNIRGWLSEINKTGWNDSANQYPLNISGEPNDLFAFKINYNTVQNETNYTGKALYNGNIAETYWRTSANNVLRKYGYFYDDISRLRNAVYQRPNTTVPVTNMYNESMSYDKNGNILTLQRYGDFDAQTGPIQIDNLNYIYKLDALGNETNQLARVEDISSPSNSTLGFKNGTNIDDDYSYDSNGNMISDKNKSVTITSTNKPTLSNIKYNHLNLPTEIFFAATKKINYIYNATGEKVQKIVTSGTSITSTDYLDGFQYANTVLQFFPHTEGYVNYDAGVYKYVFNYTDHLGNVRVSYTKDNNTGLPVIMEQNHYYPFGLKHTNYNTTVLKLRGGEPVSAFIIPYKYKYNGKELQDEFGLNLYDYEARNYDATIGRWMNIDSHSENYYSISSYVSFVNNPISFVDPTGEDILFWQLNKKGEYEQVTFNKLDKKVQQGIIDFAKTDVGYDFLANFANKGDKLGDSGISFSKEGKYSKHNFNVLQMDNSERSEGTSDERVSKYKIDFYMEINKDMPNPKINMAETIGHETFLHIYYDMIELIKAFDTKGWASAYGLSIKQYQNNKSGYKDHLSIKDDKKGRAKMYYEFITQLKTVLNPNEVQKHVNKEVEKTYNAGKNDAPKK